jgi:hypothetical protein
MRRTRSPSRGRYRPSHVYQRLVPGPVRAAIRAGSPRAFSRRDKAACRRLHGPRASPVTASPAERSARCGRRPARRTTRRGSRDCRHATLNRPCVQISHSGVTEQEPTDVQAATHIGGYSMSSGAQRKLLCVTEKRWVHIPDRRLFTFVSRPDREVICAQIIRLWALPPGSHGPRCARRARRRTLTVGEELYVR